MRILYTRAILLLLLCSGLIASAQVPQERAIMDLIRKNAASLRLSPEDIDNSFISNSYVDEKTNIRYVYLQQGYNGFKVFNSIKSIIFRDNEALYSSGQFVQGLSEKAGAATVQISAENAIRMAATHLKIGTPNDLRVTDDQFASKRKMIFSAAGIAKEKIETELYWVAAEDGKTVRLGWNVNIDVAGSSDWWNVRVDAQNGNVLEKDNWTVHEAPHHNEGVKKQFPSGAGQQQQKQQYKLPPTVTSGSYYVVPFPGESPKHKPLALENNPWLKAGTTNNATTHGWHFDGTNNYDITRGNNVFAYLDVQSANAPNGSLNWPDTSSTANPSLSFIANPSFTQEPGVKVNKKAAVTNLFYWNNLIHDVTYQYGFNEVSGNFQADNLGRGGTGGDYVQAEAQDASGTNNANFATPADGSRPRMQMFLWSAAATLTVNTPGSIAGSYSAVESNFSTANKLQTVGSVTSQVLWFNDQAGGTTHEACNGAPNNNITGKIALIQRGTCNFVIKVKAAQDAGAVGVIMVNNVAGDPIVMGGTDNTITIPAVMVSQSDGAILANQLALNATVNATLSAVGLDGDFDNGVVVHEYGHGVSNRLTGGPANASCLSNAEQAGEGWSDYLALMMTTNWQTAQLTDGPLRRAMGTYVFGQPVTGGGIRTYPYSTDMSINPLTYSNMATQTEVHFIGEIWCATLWDMTWNIIQQAGTITPNFYSANATGGNVIAMRLVMEGMRLQPCRPGFLDARDAILAADSILYGGAYKCAIWRAFARRGMGFSAVQGLSTSATDQVAAFDVPSAVTLRKTSQSYNIQSQDQQVINLSASCQCQPQNNYTIRDTIPAGFTYVSSTGGGTLSGNVVSFSSLNFTQAQEVKNFTITLKATMGGCGIDSAINDNREALTVGGLASTATTGSFNWISSSARSKSGTSSWYAVDPAASTDFSLTSNAITPGQLSVLSFWHYYVLENTIDGGRVEITKDNGATWMDAGPYMVQNGYNATMAIASPWGGGNRAFTGVSYAQGSQQFINTIINLSSFAGQSIKVRFRMQTSATNTGTYEGWFIDDIALVNGCGGLVRAGLYNASNAVIDSTAVPVFVRPGANAPASIVTQPASVTACSGTNATFTVVASNNAPNTYQWQVSTNGGTTFTNIAGATSASYTVNAVTAAQNTYQYRCIVDNGFGSVTSSGAVLTVSSAPTAPAITNAAVCEGGNASFTTTATGVTYQWQLSTDNGATFNNVAGATNNTINLTNITAAQNNNRYRVVVGNTCGTANSNSATLTVNAPTAVTVNGLPATICSSDPALALNASVTGGTWSGTGVTGGSFNPSQTPGNYTLTYTYTNANGCTSTANGTLAVVDCADRLLTLENGAIIIYPNPNGGVFNIRIRSAKYTALSMRVYGSDGRLVYVQELNGLTYGSVRKVNIQHLANDVYQLSLKDPASGAQKTFQVIVNR